MTEVQLHPDLVSPEDCRLLVRGFESAAPWSRRCDQQGAPLVFWNDARLPPEARAPMLAAVAACARFTAADLGGQSPLYLETVLLARLVDGQGHVAHADNARLVDGAWQANHTPQRDYAGLLYLNSDFDGGQLLFRERAISITPRAGLYVTFPCDQRFVHEVPPVTRGLRYSMALWFTGRRQYADPPLLYLGSEPA